MAESHCRVGEIDICYETFGDPGDPAILLIMGLGTQMVAWHDDFCAELAERGFFVIRHDNRDIGRSTHLDGAPIPSLVQLARRDRNSPYTLADMAADSVGVLDHLGIEQAHIVGASMGGMIAQTLAIRFPQRAAEPRLDHVQHRLVLERPARADDVRGAAQALAEGPRGLHPARRRHVHQDRRLRLRARHRGPARDRDAQLRPRPRPARLAAPAVGDRRRPRPRARPAPPAAAGDRRARHRGQARPAVRRPHDREGDPGREAGRDRRHGPRPAARRLARDPRRDRGHR